MTTNTKMIMSLFEFTTAFIKEHGSEKMIKQWESNATKDELKKILVSDKKIKDPDAPKNGLSAYMFFCKDQRDKVREETDKGAKDLMVELGARWNALKENHAKGKEKKQWDLYEKQAAEDKQRYKDEMDEYVPPTESRMEELREKAATKKRKSSSKSDKDPNAPKAAKSAYIFFTLEERSKIKDENPGMGGADVMVELGVRWKELKSDPSRDADLSEYMALAAEDKERYLAEKSAYNDKKSEDEEEEEVAPVPPPVVRQDEEEEEEEKPKKRKKSGLKMFNEEFESVVVEENPDMSKANVKKELKKRWGNLSKEEQDEWTVKANK